LAKDAAWTIATARLLCPSGVYVGPATAVFVVVTVRWVTATTSMRCADPRTMRSNPEARCAAPNVNVSVAPLSALVRGAVYRVPLMPLPLTRGHVPTVGTAQVAAPSATELTACPPDWALISSP
jgi:hypothetical protein